jgi:lipoprotein-releasing system ATP-binding protein
MSDPILVTSDLRRSFVQGDVTIEVLRGVDLSIGRGEIVALLGPSGSGKSTLLQAVGLLEGGFQGSIRLAGEEAARLDDEGRTRLRREVLGFVYQFHHLLPEFNAVENVVLPQLVRGAEPAAARERAQQLLGALRLGERLDHRPSKLSGGEQQRVAVARALANKPPLVLADEPTGNLDEGNATAVLQCLRDAVRRANACALMVTHSQRAAAMADRVMHLAGGSLREKAP